MKKIVQLIFFYFLTVTVSAEPKTALVIGNSAYKNTPLTNPVNDASDIADKLRLLGFNVSSKKDLTRKQMRKAMTDYGKKLKNDGGVGVFFYAGHGVQFEGKNYLIPINADINSELEIPDEGVAADLLLRVLDDAENTLNIIVLDACRNNPHARSFRSSTAGLARMEGGTGTLIAYSTGPGHVALDGDGRNSPYTKYLLKYMTQRGLSIEQVFKRVRVGVEDDSGGKQTPWETSSLRGDFYFVPGLQAIEAVNHSEAKKVVQPIVEKIDIKPEIKKTVTPIQTLAPSPFVPLSKAYKLTIYTNPSDSRIHISNLNTPFQNGKKLTPGDYNVEISRDGYMSKKQWINIDQNDVEIQVTLIPLF